MKSGVDKYIETNQDRHLFKNKNEGVAFEMFGDILKLINDLGVELEVMRAKGQNFTMNYMAGDITLMVLEYMNEVHDGKFQGRDISAIEWHIKRMQKDYLERRVK